MASYQIYGGSGCNSDHQSMSNWLFNTTYINYRTITYDGTIDGGTVPLSGDNTYYCF